MRTIKEIKTLNDFKLECIFDDGTKGIADIKPFLSTEAFRPLAEPKAFSAIRNCGYFVEWSQYELDLSADTLWHIAESA